VAGRTQRTLVSAAALLAGLVTVVAVVAWLGTGGGSSVTTGPPPGAAQGIPPPPPAGSLVLAKEAGSYAVALAAQPRRVTAIVLSPSGGPASGLALRFRAGGRTLTATPCGPGCYRAGVQGRPRLVEALAKQGSLCSTRDGSLRVSLHYYNTEGDVDMVLAALDHYPDLLVHAPN